MPKYVALLRGINVGGHKVIRMSELAAMFSSLGFTNVRTYIASGNVLFDAPEGTSLGDILAKGIMQSFGHEIVVVIRACKELVELASALDAEPSAHVPSPRSVVRDGE